MQVVLTLAGVAAFAMSAANMAGPSAIILGGALAMSSTAVGIQVLEDRGEMGSRHGRAIFSVLLLQVRILGERRQVLRWGKGKVRTGFGAWHGYLLSAVTAAILSKGCSTQWWCCSCSSPSHLALFSLIST